MLHRVTATNGVVYYRSPVLDRAGVPHGFSTRIGGVSPGPFDSLNLGNPNGAVVQDDVERIVENYHRLAVATGLGDRRLCRTHQVHGCGLALVASAETFDNSEKADALVTADRAALLSVRVADCVPVLLATVDGNIVAAVHAGWRGVIANATGVAVGAIRQRAGRDDVRILAAIGPSISAAAFEVGPEVAHEFTTTFGTAAPVVYPPGASKPHVDLRTALWLQLIGLGIDEADIDTNDRCTVRDADEFYSHRRDNGVTGRMAAVIGMK
jgi:YfiH family protein